MPTQQIGQYVYRRFEPQIPAVDDSRRERDAHKVVIVGGGPVGLATALGLANAGVDSVVIEADDSVCEGSRAACVSRRSLEILGRLGAVDAFIAKGLPWTRGRSYFGETEVLVFDMPSGPDDRFPPMINLEQFYIEQYLLDAIEKVNARFPGCVDIRWASKVIALRSSKEEGVTVQVSSSKGDYEIRSEWLVACDGGQSFVRTTLGLDLHGVGYQGRYAIVDIELESQYPTERRAWFDPPWARGTTILMHRQPDNIWRVDYQLAQGRDTAEALGPDEISRFVQTHLDAIGEGHLPWKPVWTSIYRAGAMTLDSYRHGRVLFAGNAAHAMPIFGVRGLNSGFDDADNLSWKLAAVVRGKAEEAILDSYSDERIAAFHVNAENAMRSTEFMSPPNRGFELMREACLSLAARHTGIARLVNPRQTHAITYADSALSSPSDAFEAGPPPGAPLADGMALEGRFLTDLLAKDAFTLVVFGKLAGSKAIEEATRLPNWDVMRCQCVVIPEADGKNQANGNNKQAALAAAYGAQMGSAYLVRPDGHVCGRWHSPSVAVVLGAIQRACGNGEVIS